MSFTVAANIRLAGSAQGTFLDDLTNPNVGKWPKTQAIKKITNVVVYTGEIIDSVRITYDVDNGAGVTSPVTVQHGGNSGAQNLSFALGASEKLLAVYGTRLVGPSIYGDRNIVQLSFVVSNTSGTTPTVQVYTVSGNYVTKYGAATEKFELAWPLTAASSYTLQPSGLPDAFLQAIGFTNALAAPATLL
ncbi:hypothetical protein H4582DRAFT_2203553 [Lactarius indigo]|nr:hypothetical protein H4582DRAFT_2203553 [Lactarius indigo]